MKANSILSFAIACIFCSVFSCTKEIVAPDLEGSLVGFVITLDEYGNLLESHDNVHITALGIEQYSTKTDMSGRFEFKGLPAGTYEIHIEKEGFGTMKQFGVQHLGGQPTLLGQHAEGSYLHTFCLFQTLTSSIVHLSIIKDTITATIDFNGNDPTHFNYGLFVYFSGNENFELKDAEYITQSYTISTQNTYKGVIGGLEMKFGSGKPLAYKARIIMFSRIPYQMHVHGIESYFDYSLNETVHPNLGPESNEYSYVVP